MESLFLIHSASHHAARVLSPSHFLQLEWQVIWKNLRLGQGGGEEEDKKPFVLHQS
jgi:hypothetical protein